MSENKQLNEAKERLKDLIRGETLSDRYVSDIDMVLNRVINLEEAIKTHRSQKADDRCIEDDDRLYAVLGDGIACDRRVGNKAEMLKNCERFIANRCEAGTWKSYAELESKVEDLKRELADTTMLSDRAQACYKELGNGLKKILGLTNWPNFHKMYGPGSFVSAIVMYVADEFKTLRSQVELCQAYGDMLQAICKVADAAPNDIAGIKGETALEAVERLKQEKVAAEERILMAGGYHQRTQEEVDIEATLNEIPEGDRDPIDHAIAYLLKLVDTGRNRLHEVECKNEEMSKKLFDNAMRMAFQIKCSKCHRQADGDEVDFIYAMTCVHNICNNCIGGKEKGTIAGVGKCAIDGCNGISNAEAIRREHDAKRNSTGPSKTNT